MRAILPNNSRLVMRFKCGVGSTLNERVSFVVFHKISNTDTLFWSGIEVCNSWCLALMFSKRVVVLLAHFLLFEVDYLTAVFELWRLSRCYIQTNVEVTFEHCGSFWIFFSSTASGASVRRAWNGDFIKPLVTVVRSAVYIFMHPKYCDNSYYVML